MRISAALLALGLAAACAAPALAAGAPPAGGDTLAVCDGIDGHSSLDQVRACTTAAARFIEAHRDMIEKAQREIHANEAAIQDAQAEIRSNADAIRDAAREIRQSAELLRDALRTPPPDQTPAPDAGPQK